MQNSTETLCNFTKILCKPITLHKEIDPENIILTYDYKKLIIVDRNDINENIYLEHEYVQREHILFKIPKTIINDESIRNAGIYTTHYNIYPYANLMNVDDEKIGIIRKYYRKRSESDSDLFNRYACLICIENIENEYYINYYINNRILSNIEQSKREYNLHILYNAVNQQLFHDVYENLDEKLQLNNFIECDNNKYDNFRIRDTTGNYLLDSVKLFDYQLKDIKWMNELETKITNSENKVTFTYTNNISCINDRFVFNGNKLKIYNPESINIKTDTFEFMGGNLISDLGLGKTLIALYHIISSCDKEQQLKYDNYVSFVNTCNYFYKRGTKKGEICNKNPIDKELYCKEHKDVIFVEKRGLVYKNLENLNLDDYIINHYNPLTNRLTKLFKTNASLIFCPSQLCDQWIREYYDKFIPNQRILMISTKDQYDNITLGDLLFADIVIVSYNFLLNDNYKQNDFIRINKNNDVKSLLNNRNSYSFSLFMWNRIFLDEVHEIQNMQNSNKITNIIKNINSVFKWNISGTPFSNGLSGYLNILNYNTTLNMNSYEYIEGYKTINLYKLIEYKINGNLIDKTRFLFRRNTKNSIKTEYSGNIISEYTNLIDFTEQERAIYDSYLIGIGSKYSEFLIKLCCHCQLNNDTRDIIRNCKTLTEIQNALFQHNRTKLDNINDRLYILENEISDFEKNLKELPDTDENIEKISEIKMRLSVSKRSFTILKSERDNLSRTFNYLKNTLDKLDIKEEVDNCPICLEDILDGNLAFTKCGHKFCWDCIDAFCKSGNSNIVKCPHCKTELRNNDIFLVKNIENKEKVDVSNELMEIINDIKSSKIGSIIYFLKNLKKSDKVILFSQWDELLTLVGNNLIKYGINIVYCNGSVYKRKKNISEFKSNSNINIIMLSSRNAASGLNLTEANKIILLEPIYGNKEYRNAIENQAIGRADRIGQKNPIEVFRFVIKDTIEEDIITNKIDDSKLKIMMI